LLVRTATALVILAAFLAAVFYLERPYPFGLVTGAIICVGAYEWSRLNGIGVSLSLVYVAACAYLVHGFVETPAILGTLLLVTAVFWILVVPAWLARGFLGPAYRLEAPVGLVVLVPTGVAAALLSPGELLLLLGLTWVADTAAYLAGRAFGRRKMAPSISPGKTWEGALGAAVACIIYAIICAMFVPSLRAQIQGTVWLWDLLGAAFLLVASIVGDLFESALKRRVGAKDSGAILPGHGGILDRIDSATAVLPLGALLLRQLERA
jgi:phosphatidate cytidylyltransferase